MNDYYAVLGVERKAAKKEIKEAYRFLAAQLHPDKHQGRDAKIAEKKLKEINEAYEILSNDTKRAIYDNTVSGNYNQNTTFNNHSQTWKGIFGGGLEYTATVITIEQFERIVQANEVTYDYVWLQFNDRSKIDFGKIISGTMPKFNGPYCLSRELLPKNSYGSASLVYGNTQTGELSLQFLSVDISAFSGSNTLFNGRIISLRHNWNEYARIYNLFINLVNGK
jgi:curved DNA-binding protein CbpA